MLSHSNAWLDPICMHLTSEKAKDRSDSMSRLVLLLKDPKRVKKMTSDEASRIIKSFFSLISIEFKYAFKADNKSLTPVIQNKLTNLLIEAKSLLRMFIQCRHFFHFDDAIPSIFECIMPLLCQETLSEFHPSMVGTIGSVTETAFYRAIISRSDANCLLTCCIEYSNTQSSYIPLIENLSKYFTEHRCLSSIKKIATQLSELLLQDAYSKAETVAVSLLSSLSTCLSMLAIEAPIFVSSLAVLEQLHLFVQRPIYIKWPCLQILFVILDSLFSAPFSSSILEIRALRCAFLNESVLRRIKLENFSLSVQNPVIRAISFLTYSPDSSVQMSSSTSSYVDWITSICLQISNPHVPNNESRIRRIINNTDITNADNVRTTLVFLAQCHGRFPALVIPFVMTHSVRAEYSCFVERILAKLDFQIFPPFTETYESFIGEPMKIPILKLLFMRHYQFLFWSSHSVEAYTKLINVTICSITARNWKKFLQPSLLKLITCPLFAFKRNSDANLIMWKDTILHQLQRYATVSEQFLSESNSSTENNVFKIIQELYRDFILFICSNDAQILTIFASQWNSTIPLLKSEESIIQVSDLFVELFDLSLNDEQFKLLYSSLIKLAVGGINSAIQGDVDIDEFANDSAANDLLFRYITLLCVVIEKLQLKSTLCSSIDAIVSDCYIFLKRTIEKSKDIEIHLFIINALKTIPPSWIGTINNILQSVNREHSPQSFFQLLYDFEKKMPSADALEEFQENFIRLYMDIFCPSQVPRSIYKELKRICSSRGIETVDYIQDNEGDLDCKVLNSSDVGEESIHMLAELLSSVDASLVNHPAIKQLYANSEVGINIPLLCLACIKNPASENNYDFELASHECYYLLKLLNSFVPTITSDKLACTSFAPFMARCLLDYHKGIKENSECILSCLKSILTPTAFEQEFKHKFLRIISCMAIFTSNDNSYSDSGNHFFLCAYLVVFSKAVDHVCQTLNLSLDSVKSSAYAKVLSLEFEHINSKSLLSKIYPKLFQSSQELLGRMVPKSDFCPLSDEMVTPLEADPLLHLCGALASPGQSEPVLASKLVIDVLERIGSAIPDHLCQYVLPKYMKNVFKTKITKERIVPGPINSLQDLIEYAVIVCGLNRRYVELWHQPLTPNQSSLKYLLAKAFSEDPTIISRISSIDFRVLSLESAPKSSVFQEILIEAWKIYQTRNLNGSFLNVPSVISFDDPLRTLFFLESIVVSEPSFSSLKHIYTALNNHDYLEYITYVENPLLSMADSQWRSLFDENITESHLLNQRWDVEVSSDFSIKKTDDLIFAQVRSGELIPSLISSSLKVDLASSFVLESLMHKNDVDMVAIGFHSWDKSKHTKPDTRLRLIRAFQSSPCDSCKVLAKYCEADLLWKGNFREAAVSAITCASKMIEYQTPLELKNLIFLKAGKYLWKTRQAPVKHILQGYFDKVDLQNASGQFIGKTSFALASFLDENYQKMYSSELLKARRKLLGEAKKELENLNRFAEFANPKEAAAYESSKKMLETQVAQDTLEIENLIADRQKLAIRAVENYIKAVSQSEKYDLTVFRLVALWFSFKQLDQMNRIFSSEELPLSKLIPLIYQLTARCEATESDCRFQQTLQSLLLKLLVKYPHHCAYQLLAMKAGGECISTKRKIVGGTSVQEKRSLAASQILSKAKATSNVMNTMIRDMESLSSALVEVAKWEVPMETTTKSYHSFESKWKIRSLANLSCSIPTANIPIDMDDSVTDKLVSFSQRGYQVLGGINMPKIVECVGSSGKLYRMLVKGKDDLRQDAVMEQSFLLVNQILKQSKNTEGLYLNTYRVVPLQPLAGVLEWIDEAVPIGDYLNSAHERRHPGDITPKEARSIMKREFDRPESNPVSKVRVYKEKITSKFRPVFHYFFLETTYSCEDWYHRRSAYIRSVAVSSVVGYIVGLGDRHCQNIMIGRKSGELVHIDLNMIFEMGKQLRIPERVPFRLTRDIVDGMGYLGLEAGFSFSARKTVAALRLKMEMMLMIMEAFKYDPLHRWTRKPPQFNANSTQHATLQEMDQLPMGRDDEEEDENIPKEAERALLRVREKLQGIEEGSVLSESGQVAYLIQQATNEEILAQMYPGWQPWM